MIKSRKKTILVGTAILLLLCIVFSTMPHYPDISYAANVDIKLDDTNVMDDLQNSIIDGKDYSLAENDFFADYNFDRNKPTQLFSFVEYCYSFYKNSQDNYGLYVYVYNPQGIKFFANGKFNKITMRVGNDESQPFIKYSLLYLNRCEKQDYEGLFYKYKIILSPDEQQRILHAVNSSERQYYISEIELQTQGANAVSYYVGTKYWFAGYAAGYGANENAESTLRIRSEQADTLPLDVHSTFFRPSGTNTTSDYTQDTLHSVYFAVPNKYLNTYGEMTAVHAIWLNAMLNWGLVTGHKESYDIIRGNFIGQKPNSDILPSMFVSGARTSANLWNTILGNEYITNAILAEKILNDTDKGHHIYNRQKVDSKYFKSEINALYSIFYSGAETDSADTYTVSDSQLLEYMQQYTAKYGGELVVNKYSKSLFESVDNEMTEVNWDYKTDWSDKLTSRKLVRNFWDKFWGRKGTYKITDTFKDVYAVKEIVPEDFWGKSEDDIARDLLIQKDDYLRTETGLKAVYDEATKNAHCEKNSTGKRNENDSTVYLFRYKVSEYFGEEAARFTEASIQKDMKLRDTNNYFFKQSVDLDFDIIDVTFSNGEKDTVIPVAMSPIDIVHSATPPVYTKSDKNKSLPWWVALIFLLALVCVLCVIFPPLLPLIINSIMFVITAPFKLVGNIVKGVKKQVNKSKDRKRQGNKDGANNGKT